MIDMRHILFYGHNDSLTVGDCVHHSYSNLAHKLDLDYDQNLDPNPDSDPDFANQNNPDLDGSG